MGRSPHKTWPYSYPPSPPSPPATPTVYPIDDQVKEGLLGPDGKPLAEGMKRKHPIGFHKQDPGRPHPKPPPPPPPPPKGQ